MWNSIIGCSPFEKKFSNTWIEAVGVPLHLWSQGTFKEIGNICDGYVSIEEETNLKNHLKWVRIQIAGDGGDCLNEISIQRDEIKITIPIWVEKGFDFKDCH